MYKIYTKRNLKCVNFLFIFYLVYSISNCCIDYKYLSKSLNFDLLIFTSALLSFAFVLDDIVAEVYGIKTAAKFYVSMIIIRMLMTIPFYLFYSHLSIAKYLLFITFYHPIAFTFAWYINVCLLTKWKALMHGKYFWLRSIGTSGISVIIIYLLATVEDIKFSPWSYHQIFFYDFIFSNIFSLVFNIIFAFLGNFIVSILKIIEYSNHPVKPKPFNPFKDSKKFTEAFSTKKI